MSGPDDKKRRGGLLSLGVLAARIETERRERVKADAEERSAREKADAAIDEELEEHERRMEALGLRIDAKDERVDRLERRLAWVESHTDFRGSPRRRGPKGGG